MKLDLDVISPSSPGVIGPQCFCPGFDSWPVLLVLTTSAFLLGTPDVTDGLSLYVSFMLNW